MRSSRARWRLCLVTVLAGAVSLFSTGAAEAAWTVPGSGTATARAAVLAPPAVSQTVNQECTAGPVPVRRSPNGSSFTSGANSGTLTISRPSGAQVGDVMIAGIGWIGGAAVTDASGLWTAVFQPQLTDASVSQYVYYRVVTAAEPPSYSWTGTADATAGGIVAYSGVDPVTPIHARSGQVNTSRTAPSLTTTRANVRLVGLWSLSAAQTSTVPAGMTEIWNGASSGVGGDGGQVHSVAADEPWPTPGPTGTRTLGGSGTESVNQLVALQPPVRPYATTTWTPSSSTWASGQVFRLSTGGTVQRQATLAASATTQTDGPLTSGTPYTADVTATRSGWTSSTAGVSFTARSC